MQDYIAGARSLVDASAKRTFASARKLSPEARKGVAVVVAAVLSLVIVALVLALWHSSVRDEVQQLTAERDMVAARAAKATQSAATRLGSADKVTGMFLEGATPGLAVASFQGLVGDAAANSGLSVKRIQPLATGDEAAAGPYRLGIDAEGSLDQLRAFLVQVESSLPVMFVSGLEVRPGAADGAETPFPAEALKISVRIDAYGWRASQ